MLKTLYESLLFVACVSVGFVGGLYATKLISGTAVVLQSGTVSDKTNSEAVVSENLEVTEEEKTECLDGLSPDGNVCCSNNAVDCVSLPKK